MGKTEESLWAEATTRGKMAMAVLGLTSRAFRCGECQVPRVANVSRN